MRLHARIGGIIVRTGAISAVAAQAIGVDDAFDVFGIRQIGVGQVTGRAFVVWIIAAAFTTIPTAGTKCRQAHDRDYLI